MRKKHIIWSALTGLFVVVIVGTAVYAAQGFYVVDKSVRPGMLMSVSSNPDVVEPASDNTADKLVGVMGDETTVLNIQPEQIQVETGGVTPTLVSTLNGDIKKGDRIAPSSILGFGAKQKGDGWIVGIAQSDLTANTDGVVKSSVMDEAENKHDVFVGSIDVAIKVTYFSEVQASSDRNVLPRVLQQIADSIAGKRASQVAVVLGFILVLGGLVTAGVIINSAVRNGIVAISRQPLSKQSIVRQMIRACLLGLGILGAMIAGALVVLRVL